MGYRCTLQNPSEVLQPAIAERLQLSMTSDSTIHVVTMQDWSNRKVTAQNTTNTWKWLANNISDIAIGISDHYDWDAASVVVDNKTKRRGFSSVLNVETERPFLFCIQQS
jgi:hypothetical protein